MWHQLHRMRDTARAPGWACDVALVDGVIVVGSNEEDNERRAQKKPEEFVGTCPYSYVAVLDDQVQTGKDLS